jgi:hypothetical protein
MVCQGEKSRESNPEFYIFYKSYSNMLTKILSHGRNWWEKKCQFETGWFEVSGAFSSKNQLNSGAEHSGGCLNIKM